MIPSVAIGQVQTQLSLKKLSQIKVFIKKLISEHKCFSDYTKMPSKMTNSKCKIGRKSNQLQVQFFCQYVRRSEKT